MPWAGAQAIAAAAFGSESIAPVEKVVGPGGVWVTEAKRQIFGRCGVDSLAGPAEVLVVADDGANSEFVAGELLAAAEQIRGRSWRSFRNRDRCSMRSHSSSTRLT